MVKKFAALAAGVSLLALGIAPVFAQGNSGTSETNVDITNNVTLTVTNTVGGGSATPFGDSTHAYSLTPTSTTSSTKVRAGSGAAIANCTTQCATTTSTLALKTNSTAGGTITATASNSGVLTKGGDTIPNAGSGPSLADTGNVDGGCGIAAEADTTATGLSVRVAQTGTDAAYSGPTALISDGKDFGTDATTSSRLWCHLTSASPTLAKTATFHEFHTDAIMDFLIASFSGINAGVYTSTVTLTGSAN